MPKNLFQDMVKVKRMRREESGKTASREVDSAEGAEEHEKIKKTERKEPRRSRSSSKYTLWGVAIIALGFLLFALSYKFSNATITLNPKIQEVVLNENLSATKDAADGALAFDLVVISGEEYKIVPAGQEREVSDRAEGTVIIYNTFSTASQALNIDTRLEGSNGKIYKTKVKTVVPGMKAGGAPGSVEVEVYATEAGAEYNSGPLDFKIFGFKGTSKYEKFYARSKGEIAGGLKGKFPTIGEDDKKNAVDEMKVSLREKLLAKATEQIPEGFILFPDAVFLTTEDSSIDLALVQDGMLPLKLKGTLSGILFNEQKLTEKIVRNKIKNFDNSPVYLSKIKDLSFTLSNKDSVSLSEVKSINFNLSGNSKIVWRVDAEKLMLDLAGKGKKDFNQVLTLYSTIDSAHLSLSPIWVRSIPEEEKDIKLIVNYPE